MLRVKLFIDDVVFTDDGYIEFHESITSRPGKRIRQKPRRDLFGVGGRQPRNIRGGRPLLYGESRLADLDFATNEENRCITIKWFHTISCHDATKWINQKGHKHMKFTLRHRKADWI